MGTPHHFLLLSLYTRWRSQLQGELARRIGSHLAGLLPCTQALLVGSELTALGTGQLWPQVPGLVLLAAVELSQILLLRLVDDCQHSCNGLAHHPDLGQLGRSTAGHFGDPQRGQFLLEVLELLHQLFLLLTPQLSRFNLGLR